MRLTLFCLLESNRKVTRKLLPSFLLLFNLYVYTILITSLITAFLLQPTKYETPIQGSLIGFIWTTSQPLLFAVLHKNTLSVWKVLLDSYLSSMKVLESI